MLSILQALFVTCIIVTNIVAAKVVFIFGLQMPADFIYYSACFLITDIIGEVYGREKATETVMLGFLGSVTATVMIYVSRMLPAADFSIEVQGAMDTFFANNPRIVFASMIAFLVSQNIDVIVFNKIGVKMHGKHKWIRNNVSTIFSQLLDSTLFCVIAFYGIIPNLIHMILSQYALKIFAAIIDTPIFYILTRKRGVFTQ